MFKMKVTRNGQTTIPAKLREKYGIEEGSVLMAEETEDGILIRVPEWIETELGSAKYDVEKMKKKLDEERERWS